MSVRRLEIGDLASRVAKVLNRDSIDICTLRNYFSNRIRPRWKILQAIVDSLNNGTSTPAVVPALALLAAEPTFLGLLAIILKNAVSPCQI